MELSIKDITSIYSEVQKRKYTKEFLDITIYNVQTQDMNVVETDLTNINKVMKKSGIVIMFVRSKNLMDLVLVTDGIFGKINRQEFITISKPVSSQNDKFGIQSNSYFAVIYFDVNEGSGIVKSSYVHSKVYRDKNDKHLTYTKGSEIATRKSGGTLYARKNLGATIYYNPETEDVQIREDYDKNLIKENSKISDIYVDCKNLIENGYTPIRPKAVRKSLGSWTWSTEKLESNKEDLMIIRYSDRYVVRKKKYVSEERIYKEGEQEYVKELKQIPIRSSYEEEKNKIKETTIEGDSKYIFSLELIQDILNASIIDSIEGKVAIMAINSKNMRIKDIEKYLEVSKENRANIDIEIETVEYMR